MAVFTVAKQFVQESVFGQGYKQIQARAPLFLSVAGGDRDATARTSALCAEKIEARPLFRSDAEGQSESREP